MKKDLQFAKDDEEAAEKYERCKTEDPLPDIKPGLLSADSIRRYVAATGMVYPFNADSQDKHLKQASYAVKLLGQCIYWDLKEKKHDQIVKDKDEYVLKQNSITFVSLEPRFRLPYYIALRFNLKITHIHRGILLGTGPLVDPGFDGRLLVPLHNLTMNDYVVRGGEDLIWFEFTKLDPDSCVNIAEFPKTKSLKDANDYLHKAYNGHPIASSLSDIRQVSEMALSRTSKTTWGGIIAILALLASMIYPTWSLFSDSVNFVKGAKDAYRVMDDAQTKKIQALEKEIDSLKSKIQMIEQKSLRKQENVKPGTITPRIKPETRR